MATSIMPGHEAEPEARSRPGLRHCQRHRHRDRSQTLFPPSSRHALGQARTVHLRVAAKLGLQHPEAGELPELHHDQRHGAEPTPAASTLPPAPEEEQPDGHQDGHDAGGGGGQRLSGSRCTVATTLVVMPHSGQGMPVRRAGGTAAPAHRAGGAGRPRTSPRPRHGPPGASRRGRRHARRLAVHRRAALAAARSSRNASGAHALGRSDHLGTQPGGQLWARRSRAAGVSVAPPLEEPAHGGQLVGGDGRHVPGALSHRAPAPAQPACGRRCACLPPARPACRPPCRRGAGCRW